MSLAVVLAMFLASEANQLVGMLVKFLAASFANPVPRLSAMVVQYSDLLCGQSTANAFNPLKG